MLISISFHYGELHFLFHCKGFAKAQGEAM